MKIYTKTGDSGTTGLYGGTRIPKNHIRLESYGTIDELNSWLGLIRDQEIDNTYRTILIGIQEQLFVMGAILASEPETAKETEKKTGRRLPEILIADVEILEQEIDRMNESLPAMTHFILPGGHTTVSYCHIARTVCRRAERQIARLHFETPVNENLLIYTNRLSDYLFVLARKLSHDLGADEIKWIPGGKS